MTDLRELLPLFGATITEPEAAARAVLGLRIGSQALWLALCLASVLAVLTAALLEVLIPTPPELAAQAIHISPFAYAIIVMAMLMATAFALHWTGTSLGGAGRLEDSIAAVVWLQFLLILLQLGQAVLALMSPILGGLAALASLVIMLWSLINFVDVVHDFESRAKAAGVVLVALVGVAIGLGLILAMIGAGAAAGNGFL